MPWLSSFGGCLGHEGTNLSKMVFSNPQKELCGYSIVVECSIEKRTDEMIWHLKMFLWPGKIRWVHRGFLPGICFFKFGGWAFVDLFWYFWNMYKFCVYIYDGQYLMRCDGSDTCVYLYDLYDNTGGWNAYSHHICRADRMFYVELIMDGIWLSSMDDLWIRYDLWKENSLSLFFRSYK